MSSTPDDAAAPEPTSPAEVIMGGDQPRTLDGKEVAPLREKYPTPGNGWILCGVALFLVALMFALADVTVSKRPDTITDEQQCGTWLQRHDPEDKDWIGACHDAYDQRTWLVGAPVVLGLASIGYGVRLRTRRPR